MTRASASFACQHCKRRYPACVDTDRPEATIVCPYCKREQDPAQPGAAEFRGFFFTGAIGSQLI
jgi:DNA-directed RNA polymerase subunit RPC12/RpoP